MARRVVQSPQERTFIQRYVATGDAQRAAAEAGYSQPRSQGYQALARPNVQAEVFRLQMERLTNEALPLAIDTLVACMRAPAAPWAAKNQAAKIALEYTAGRDGAGKDKDPHEMTADELNERIAALEARKVELARPIEAEVVETAPTSVFE